VSSLDPFIRVFLNIFKYIDGGVSCLAQHGTPLSMYLKRLSNTQMNGSTEDTEQELKRHQVKWHRVWT
jgi:hypothetical protein